MTARMGLHRVEAHWLVTEEQNKIKIIFIYQKHL